MRILDRYIIKSFLVNYLLALSVMVGMYVLLDLIVNVQDFAKGAAPPPPAATAPATPPTAAPPAMALAVTGPATQEALRKSRAAAAAPSASAGEIIAEMADYYSYQMLVIFQQVSGIIPLLAAGFTMVRLTRHHELTAMLASGVSLYRVAAPIILISIGFSLLNIANQEFVISQPYIIEKLLRKHDEVNQVTSRVDAVYFVVDSDNSLLSAREYDPLKKQMKDIFIVQRDKAGTPIGHIVADSATWETPPDSTLEAWVMKGVTVGDDRGLQDPLDSVSIPKKPLYIYRTGMTPAQLDLVFQKKAIDYLSSAQVRELARFSPEINQPLLYKIMHLRFTQPLMNIILLLIGIPFLLTREPNRLVINILYCFTVVGIVFILTFVIFQMGGTQLDPLLAAWLPVLLFGPLSLVMLDFVHT